VKPPTQWPQHCQSPAT